MIERFKYKSMALQSASGAACEGQKGATPLDSHRRIAEIVHRGEQTVKDDHSSKGPPPDVAARNYARALHVVREQIGLPRLGDDEAVSIWLGSYENFCRALTPPGKFAKWLAAAEAGLIGGEDEAPDRLREMRILPEHDDPYRSDTAMTVSEDEDDDGGALRLQPGARFRLRLEGTAPVPSCLLMLERYEGAWTVWRYSRDDWFARHPETAGVAFWPRQTGGRSYYARDDATREGRVTFYGLQAPLTHLPPRLMEEAAENDTALSEDARDALADWFGDIPAQMRRRWRAAVLFAREARLE